MAGDFDYDRDDEDYKPRKPKAKKKAKSNSTLFIILGIGGGLLGLLLVFGIVGYFALRGGVKVPGLAHPSFATRVTMDTFNQTPEPPRPLADYTATLGEGRVSRETDMTAFGMPGKKLRTYLWGTDSAQLALEVEVDPDGSEWVTTVAVTIVTGTTAANETTRASKTGGRAAPAPAPNRPVRPGGAKGR